MCNKRNITIRFNRICLLVKALGKAAVIPPLVLNVIIPLLLLGIFIRRGMCDEFLLTANRLYGVFLPFMLCWCPIFVQKFYFEDPGNELLFVGKNWNKTVDLVLILLLGICLEFVLSIPLFVFTYDLLVYWVKLAFVSLFYFGISYLISFVFGSITPTLLILIIYTAVNLFSVVQVVRFPFYYSPEAQTEFLKTELPLTVCGVAAVIITAFTVSRRRKIC